MLEAVERDHTEIVALLTKAIAKATAKVCVSFNQLVSLMCVHLCEALLKSAHI